MAGGTKINGSTKRISQRLQAIRLNLSEPEPFLDDQAKLLSELVIARAPRHTGLLVSAFSYTRTYKTARGAGVGIGDPDILTKPQEALPGYIKEFVAWLKEKNKQVSKAYQDQLESIRGEKKSLLSRKRSVREELRGAKPKAVKRTLTNAQKAELAELRETLHIERLDFPGLVKEYFARMKYKKKSPVRFNEAKDALRSNVEAQRELMRDINRIERKKNKKKK